MSWFIILLIGMSIGSFLTYVHTKPRVEWEKLCVWKALKRKYFEFYDKYISEKMM